MNLSCPFQNPLRCCRNLSHGAGMLSVNLSHQHWARCDERAASFEPFQPGIEIKLRTRLHIDSTMPQRNGMDAGCSAGGWAEAKAAVQQCVVHFKPELQPSPFRQNPRRFLFNCGPGRKTLSSLLEAKLSSPDAVVRQFIQIHFSHGISINDHGQLCLSRSSRASSRRACSITGPIGGAVTSNGVL